MPLIVVQRKQDCGNSKLKRTPKDDLSISQGKRIQEDLKWEGFEDTVFSGQVASVWSQTAKIHIRKL